MTVSTLPYDSPCATIPRWKFLIHRNDINNNDL